MYACGRRIGEAATLEIGTIDSDNRLLRIIGKGNKERLVPLPEPMLLKLRRLWKTHKNPRWLFPTRAATNPVGRSTLNRTFVAVRAQNPAGHPTRGVEPSQSR
jgi:integrase/recombinase XerD